MEGHRHQSVEREPEPGHPAGAADTQTLTVLQRYAAGEISAGEAAHELGPRATEHDVFAGILAAGLPLPLPAPEQLASEVAALHALYGPHEPKHRM
jgi:hypothetical protein